MHSPIFLRHAIIVMVLKAFVDLTLLSTYVDILILLLEVRVLDDAQLMLAANFSRFLFPRVGSRVTFVA